MTTWTAAALEWGHGPRVFEMFLEPTCPYSNKAQGKIKDLLAAAGEDKITVKVPMAALPESGTTVAVIIRVKTPNGKIVNLPLAGVVVEETVVVNGVARKVRKVQLELDATTMINLQAGKAYIAAVTRK